jgi:hypothetical protein
VGLRRARRQHEKRGHQNPEAHEAGQAHSVGHDWNEGNAFSPVVTSEKGKRRGDAKKASENK